MDHGIVIVPAAPIRKKAKHQSEMTNQLLFGEAVKVLKVRGALWLKIRSVHDNYEGWMTRTLLREVKEKEAARSAAFVTSAPVSSIQFEKMTMQVPTGSSLPAFSAGEGIVNDLHYRFDGHSISRNEQHPGADLIKQFTSAWLNAPYLWGGRTIFGVDCSGFVQVNYKMMGIDLPRDAWQQAQEGNVVKKLKDAVCGDLAFFDDKDEIVHVGVLLGNDQIIHASGKVRIDTIDKKGIVQTESGKRTHALKAIRRIIL